MNKDARCDKCLKLIISDGYPMTICTAIPEWRRVDKPSEDWCCMGLWNAKQPPGYDVVLKIKWDDLSDETLILPPDWKEQDDPSDQS